MSVPENEIRFSDELLDGVRRGRNMFPEGWTVEFDLRSADNTRPGPFGTPADLTGGLVRVQSPQHPEVRVYRIEEYDALTNNWVARWPD